MAGLQKRGRTVNAIAWLFALSGALLATNGCDHTSEAAQKPAGSHAGENVDREAAVEFAAAPVARSAAEYVSSADPGEGLVSGTSSLHAWTVKSNNIKGNAEFSGPLKADSASTIALVSIDLSIPVDSLKSTEGRGMDDTMHGALNFKKFPAITFKLTKASLKAVPSKEIAAYHFAATGQLTISGAAHPVDLDLAIVPHDDTRLTISTDVGLKMTDFGVTPPTAMFGVIKSGNPITVKVTWQLTMQPPKAGTVK